MILYVKGNLFQSPAQTLVNTVNTVGMMSKGVALEFKRLFPDMYSQYRALCESGQFKVGQLWLYKTPQKWGSTALPSRHWAGSGTHLPHPHFQSTPLHRARARCRRLLQLALRSTYWLTIGPLRETVGISHSAS